jgi:hypothetical protein
MKRMFLTLDVSQLNGWLNPVTCRVKRGRAVRCGVCGPGEVGGRGVVEECVQGGGRGEMQVERVQCVGTGVAHVEHGAHVCDAGGVKAQRLVESIRTLPRVERGIYAVRG